MGHGAYRGRRAAAPLSEPCQPCQPRLSVRNCCPPSPNLLGGAGAAGDLPPKRSLWLLSLAREKVTPRRALVKRTALGKFMKVSHFYLTGALGTFTISKDNFEKPPCFFAVLSVCSPLRACFYISLLTIHRIVLTLK